MFLLCISPLRTFFFGDSKSALQALLSKWDHPTVQIIMRFLVFLHTVHKTVIFCWLPSHMAISVNKRADSAAKAALQKDVSDCLISYTDAYQYISQYVCDRWQSEWDMAVNKQASCYKTLDRRTAIHLQIHTLRRSCFI